MQDVQLFEPVAPERVEKAPAGHSRQPAMALSPSVDEYRPAGQSRQGCALNRAVEYVPATQGVHWLTSLMPVCGLDVPDGQDVQPPVVNPKAVLNVPEPQFQHWWWNKRPFPVKNLPAAQSWQVIEDEAPTVAENLPGPQKVQPEGELSPTLEENVLAGQA